MEQDKLSIKKVALISGVIGILIGAVIASLVITPSNDRMTDIVTEQVMVKDTVIIEREKLVYRNKEIAKKPAKDTTALLQNDTLLALNDTIIPNDSAFIASNSKDSINETTDSLSVEQNIVNREYRSSDGGRIRVAENELVFSKRIKPEGNPALFYCNVNSELDSLLVENYSPQQDEGYIHAEFWTSPINSIGYRLNKKRLILFGFYEYQQVNLRFLENGGLEMKYFQNTYVLECGDDFKSLVIKKN